jgi:hypothetical protein
LATAPEKPIRELLANLADYARTLRETAVT